MIKQTTTVIREMDYDRFKVDVEDGIIAQDATLIIKNNFDYPRINYWREPDRGSTELIESANLYSVNEIFEIFSNLLPRSFGTIKILLAHRETIGDGISYLEFSQMPRVPGQTFIISFDGVHYLKKRGVTTVDLNWLWTSELSEASELHRDEINIYFLEGRDNFHWFSDDSRTRIHPVTIAKSINHNQEQKQEEHMCGTTKPIASVAAVLADAQEQKTPATTRPFDMKDFLSKLVDPGLQVFYMHNYPANVNYLDTLGEFHNPQLLWPILLEDYFGNSNHYWSDQYDVLTEVDLPATWEVGVANKVIVGGETRFIPMFDMHGQFYGTKEQLNRAFGKIFTEKKYADRAYVFFTGRSYHVYVNAFLTEVEWRELVIDSLLPVGIDESFKIDSRWAAHTLKEGFTAIRVTARYKPLVPVAMYGPGVNDFLVQPFGSSESLTQIDDLPF